MSAATSRAGRPTAIDPAIHRSSAPCASTERLARQVALSDADLCLVGLDGTLSCVAGSADDLASDDHHVPSHWVRRVLDGGTEVALSNDVGCAPVQ